MASLELDVDELKMLTLEELQNFLRHRHHRLHFAWKGAMEIKPNLKLQPKRMIRRRAKLEIRQKLLQAVLNARNAGGNVSFWPDLNERVLMGVM